jgi:hypothetical protein
MASAPQHVGATGDRADYPRTYRPARGWLLFSRLFAALLLGSAAWVGGGLLGFWPLLMRGPVDMIAWSALAAAGLLGGLYVAGTMHKVRLTLTQDAIELMSYGTPLSMLGLKPPLRVHRGDIVRRARTHRRRGAGRLLLYIRNGMVMRIPLIFRTDAAFRSWFKSITLTSDR